MLLLKFINALRREQEATMKFPRVSSSLTLWLVVVKGVSRRVVNLLQKLKKASVCMHAVAVAFSYVTSEQVRFNCSNYIEKLQ